MTDYEKLRVIYNQIDILLSHEGITSADGDFKAWRTKAERFLMRKYGEGSREHKDFSTTCFELYYEGIDWVKDGHLAYESNVDVCRNGLKYTKAVFELYLEEIAEEDERKIMGKDVPEEKPLDARNRTQQSREKKYQVFISSTYEDLKEERALVTQCLLDIGCIPVGMEQFPASGMSQMEYIKKMLADCDYYILILAGRYGSRDSDGISFTEKEYDYAVSVGLPVMSFVVKDIGQLQNSKCEQTDEGKESLKRFREKVCKNKMVKMYSSSAELQAAVAVSMNKCVKDFPAIGWIRANRSGDLMVSDDVLGEKIEKYLHEHFQVYQGEVY